MTIYLDFDGTMVEHIYPEMGRAVPHSVRVVDRLVKAGHEIVLNTYRADLNKDFPGVLGVAINWLNSTWLVEKTVDSIPLTRINSLKVGPWPFLLDGELVKNNDTIYLDDQSYGTPLIPAVMSNGQMVDWLAVEKILEDNSLLPKTVTDELPKL